MQPIKALKVVQEVVMHEVRVRVRVMVLAKEAIPVKELRMAVTTEVITRVLLVVATNNKTIALTVRFIRARPSSIITITPRNER